MSRINPTLQYCETLITDESHTQTILLIMNWSCKSPKIDAKHFHYANDGTGRDTYVSINNGGLLSPKLVSQLEVSPKATYTPMIFPKNSQRYLLHIELVALNGRQESNCNHVIWKWITTTGMGRVVTTSWRWMMAGNLNLTIGRVMWISCFLPPCDNTVNSGYHDPHSTSKMRSWGWIREHAPRNKTPSVANCPAPKHPSFRITNSPPITNPTKNPSFRPSLRWII